MKKSKCLKNNFFKSKLIEIRWLKDKPSRLGVKHHTEKPTCISRGDKNDKVVHARVNALGFNFEMVLYISNVFK